MDSTPQAFFQPNTKNQLTFGRYAGKTFEEVKLTDISYCNWVLKQIKPTGKMKEFQNYLQSISNHATCERCNGSGKVHIM
jgi:hypothetical protein